MNLVALCSWYQENPDWIETYVRGLGQLGVTHLIAIDGAYAAFPEASAASFPVERQAFIDACAEHDIDLTMHLPTRTWHGNEVEKRNHLFVLGETITTDDDWYLILDVDEHVHHAPEDLLEQLAATRLRVATLQLRRREALAERTADDMTAPARRFMRATRGLRVYGTHWRYLTPDGDHYWSDGDMVPALDLNVEVDHLTKHRDEARRHRSGRYYVRRDDEGLEG